MSDWNYINQHRVTHGPYASTPEDGFNGQALVVVNNTIHLVQFSDGEGWRHVSVSLPKNPTFTPSYSAMCQIKEMFWEPEDWVVQFHPAKSEYINNHPGCLHLWQPTAEKLPVPPSILTGWKELNPEPA